MIFVEIRNLAEPKGGKVFEMYFHPSIGHPNFAHAQF